MFLIVRHETDSKRLTMPARFLERRIDDLPPDAIGSRLKFVPKPATVSNGRVRKNRLRRSVRLFRRWSFFRPTETLIQRLTIKPLKGRDPHSGINEHFITRFRPDDDQFCLRRGAAKKREHKPYKQRNSAKHDCLFLL